MSENTLNTILFKFKYNLVTIVYYTLNTIQFVYAKVLFSDQTYNYYKVEYERYYNTSIWYKPNLTL